MTEHIEFLPSLIPADAGSDQNVHLLRFYCALAWAAEASSTRAADNRDRWRLR